MDEEVTNDLITAVWVAMDATDGDEGEVQDIVDQALQTWAPKD